jgi:hypothetical protein
VTGGGKKKEDKSLKLRLDVNLDVEITLEARVHAPALLYVQLLSRSTMAVLISPRQALATYFADIAFRSDVYCVGVGIVARGTNHINTEQPVHI